MNLPQDAVLATLHRAGDIWFKRDQRLIDLFDQAARDSKLFAGLERHPQYHDSRLLNDFLVTCVVGGVLRVHLATGLLSAAPCLLGAYGKSKYGFFTEEQRLAIDQIASRLRQIFS